MYGTVQSGLRREVSKSEKLVPYESAVFGLAGDRENQVRLNADHRSMCRFNPAVEVEMENYFLVRGNILDLIDSATDKSM
jgi:hypothetical protein